jgi:hypothetical protein
MTATASEPCENDRLGQALQRFVEAYQARPELVAEQRGWSPTIVLAASDTGARVTVVLEDGRVARVGGGEGAATLEVTADLEILCDVLMLRRDPNEPYLFGELSVVGAEADFVRLDYIVSRLCPQ